MTNICFSNTLSFSVKRLSILFLLFVSVICFSQNETNNWYFGNNAGLDFSNGDVTILENGGMVTPSGCSTISDDQGNLLFYTNGQTVYNKNHLSMENGEGLSGEILGIQSSIIIPKPNDPSTYYIFYVRENVQTSPLYFLAGMYYAEVKFDDQHPLGYITDIKNVRIAEVTSASSRLASVYHPETNTFRVIGITKPTPMFGVIIEDGEYIFRIFNVSENGVDQNSINISINESLGKLGAMKISPDGNFLAFADRENRKVYFYSYNNELISFVPYFTLPTIPAFGVILDPYGIEFSQDSKMFYYTGGNYVVQFPFTSLNQTEPFEYYLMPLSNPGSIQLARNGKIYIAQGSEANPIDHLAVINNPEKLGEDCNFKSSAIEFSTANSTKGLPIFVASYLRNRIIPSKDDCVDTIFNFDLDAYTNIQSVLWDFGDGTTSTNFNPTHQFNTPGVHKVKASVVLNDKTVILYKDVEAYPLPYLPPNQILSQCDVDNDGESIFNLENIKDFIADGSEFEYFFYHTIEDATSGNNQIEDHQFYANISNPEQVFVKIVSPYGCTSIGDFWLENYYPTTQTIRDFYICENSDSILNNLEGSFNIGTIKTEIINELGIDPAFNVVLYGSLLDAQTKMNPLERYFDSVTTIIWVRIEDENNNCFGVIPFNAIVNPSLELNIESNYTICDPSEQPLLVLDGGITNDSWIWKNQSGDTVSIERFFRPTEPGDYSITVDKLENGIVCSVSKEFNVKKVGAPEFVTVKTGNGEIFVSVRGNSSYEFSLDDVYYFGSGLTYTFTGVSAGIHRVYVRDINHCEKSISTEIYLLIIPEYFTPNNDSYNDVWKISGLSRKFYLSAEILIFDRYGKILHKMDMDENDEGWSGVNNNQILPATDYWYRVTLTDLENKSIVKTGHFSLKR